MNQVKCQNKCLSFPPSYHLLGLWNILKCRSGWKEPKGGLDSLATINILSAHQPRLPSRSDCQGNVAGHSPVVTSALPRAKPRNLGEQCKERISKRKTCSAAATHLVTQNLSVDTACACSYWCNGMDSKKKIIVKYLNKVSDCHDVLKFYVPSSVSLAGL